jgi:ATP-dependent DNA helicase
LDDLQAAMAADAERQMNKADKKGKKRKGEGKGKASKKSKKNNGESVEALKTAQVKDAEAREKNKPIFIQPPNLSKDCQLKDYQLEGVRWLTSLWENGVSGILADEMG